MNVFFSFLLESEKICSLFEISNTILLAVLAFLITGYTIFQAMISHENLKIFLINNSENIPLLIRYNHFFFIITILYLLFFIFKFISLSIFKLNPNVINTTNPIFVNIFLSLYLSFLTF